MSRPKLFEYKCKTCGVEGKDNFYESKKWMCKSCWGQYTYGQKKKKILEYMEKRGGAKCGNCGYDKYLGALCFHHRNPEEKDPLWHKQMATQKLYKELDKCDILCMNCHAEVHAEGWSAFMKAKLSKE